MQEEKKFSLVGALNPKSNSIFDCFAAIYSNLNYKLILYWCLATKYLLVKYKKHAIIRRKYKVLIYLTKTVKDFQDLPYSIFS